VVPLAFPVAVAPAAPIAMPALLLVFHTATIALPLPLWRLAVPVVLVTPVPVLHAKRWAAPVPLAALSRRVRLAAVTVVVVVVVVVLAGDPAPALLARVRVLAVVVVVGVRLVASPALGLHGLRRAEHVLPPVVQRVEEAILMEKPQ
jgi:hypothetical protein